jgi:LysR family transcriptional regulator, glycine cleavage system transcriptional activator
LTLPPSLKGIISVEAVARHRSFAKAAEELGVTKGAISHGVRNMEERLGARIFSRSVRPVQLTEAGSAFLQRLRSGLDLLAQAFGDAARFSESRLIVGASRACCTSGAAPRLTRFIRPEAALDLVTSDAPDAVASSRIDVAIRFGAVAHAGLATRILASEDLFPVAAPSFRRLRRPEELEGASLIEEAGQPWRLWLEPLGLRAPNPASITVDSPITALELARAGAGVCLARGLMVRDDLASGRLTRLFKGSAPVNGTYSALWNPDSPKARLVVEFIDWIGSDLRDRMQRAA